jgi:DNA replication and repair protein RecF
MSLNRLTVKNLRNIRHVDINLGPGVNLVWGANGSGKTSLLEAIYYLGSSRTFRGVRIEPVIKRDADITTVFGVVDSSEGTRRIGVQRGRDGSKDIKINGEVVRRASELAQALPVLVLGPETVDLLLGSPGGRRRFLNWGLFHVEHGFLPEWETAVRCLKQRNSLLRARGSVQELGVWSARLVKASEALDGYRSRYFEVYRKLFQEGCENLSRLDDVECIYNRGWDASRSLTEVLASQEEGDRKRGFTLSGFQKADLEVRVAGQNAVTVCSRGELKVLAWAMVLSQGKMSWQRRQQTLVYLVDDLCAELDAESRISVCQELVKSGGQVIATGIDLKQLLASWVGTDTKVFHVEHGTFSETESSI